MTYVDRLNAAEVVALTSCRALRRKMANVMNEIDEVTDVGNPPSRPDELDEEDSVVRAIETPRRRIATLAAGTGSR